MNTSEPKTTAADPYRLIGFGVMLIVLVAIAVTAFVLATDVFLILFLALLFSVFLTHCSQLVSRYLPVGYRGSLATVVVLLLVTGCAIVIFFSAKVDQKLQDAGTHLDSAQAKVQQLAEDHPMLKSAVSATPVLRQLLPSEKPNKQSSDSQNTSSTKRSGDDATQEQQGQSNEDSPAAADDSLQNGSPSAAVGRSAGSGGGSPLPGDLAQKVASTVSSAFSTTFGLVVNAILIFFVGLFIAVAPGDYRDGVVLLFPKRKRDRIREVMNTLGQTLWQWLTGRFASMAVTGAGAAILLASLQVPLGISLGILTGLLTFVPNIGSLISLLMSSLFALPQGGTTVLAVIGGYLLLQLVESYVITPLIQQKQAALPPALLIATQAVMGVVFGFLGAAVSSPLLAVVKKGIQVVYVDDEGSDDEGSDDEASDNEASGDTDEDRSEDASGNMDAAR